MVRLLFLVGWHNYRKCQSNDGPSIAISWVNRIAMKKLTWFIVLPLLLSACEIIVVDPVFDPRDNLVGSWKLDEYSSSYDASFRYRVYITKTGGQSIYIENFYDSNITIRAHVSGNRIDIPFQFVNGFEVEGSGTFSGGSLHLQYSVWDEYGDGPTDYCDTEGWRP